MLARLLNTSTNFDINQQATIYSSISIISAHLAKHRRWTDFDFNLSRTQQVFTEYARSAKEAYPSHKPFQVCVFDLENTISDNQFSVILYLHCYNRVVNRLLHVVVYHTQTLTFLIRDWPHSVEIDYGMRNGAKYLDEMLKKRSGKLDAVRSYLRRSFETINCCLLPYPGEKVAETNHSLELTQRRKSQVVSHTLALPPISDRVFKSHFRSMSITVKTYLNIIKGKLFSGKFQ